MIICMKCGQQADQGETFCRRCGAFLEWTGAPAAPPESPPSAVPTPAPSRPEHAEPEPAGPPVVASVSASSLRVDPGGQASLTVEVRNRGRTVDQLSLEVRGPAAAWTEVDPARLNLMPDTAGVATVTFRPPRTSAVGAGEYPADIAASSREHPDAAVMSHVVVEVTPFVALEAALVPSVLRGSAATTTRLQVANDGNVPLDLALAAGDPELAFEFRISPAGLRVEPGVTAEAVITVVPRQPIQAGPDRTRPFRVVVTTDDGSRRALDGTFVQVAAPPPPVSGPPLAAMLSASAVRVEPGSQASVTVEVTNRSRTAERVALEVRGPAAAWAAVEPARLSIGAEASAAATVTFRPPRTERTKPGQYPADVAVSSLDRAGVAVVERVAVDVLPFATFEASLAPSVLRGRREATTRLTVSNRGNAPAELALGGDDPEAALQFRVSPAKLRLKPGASDHATVAVKARGDNRSRADLARSFRVTVAGGDGSRQAIDGTFIQPAARGRRRWPWLLILLGGLLLALALVVPNLDRLGLNLPLGNGTPDVPHAPPIENTTGQPIYDERVMELDLDPGERSEFKVMELWSAPEGLETSCASGFFLLTWQVRVPYPDGGEDFLIETLIPMGDGRLEPRGTGSRGSVTLRYCDEGAVVNNGVARYLVELRHASGVYPP